MIYSYLQKNRVIRSLFTHFNNVSLRKKIMVTYFIFVFLLVGILAVTIYTYTVSVILRQNTFSLQQGFNQANAYLSYRLASVDSSSDMIIYNDSLNTILNKEPSGRPNLEQIEDSKTILRLLKNLQENDDIKLARIYVPDTFNFAGSSINIGSLSQAKTSPWWEMLLAKKGLHLFVGNDSLEDSTGREQTYIALLRAMYRKDDYSRLAFILRLDIPVKTVEEILNSANYTSDSMTLLYDYTGTIVACSKLSDAEVPFTGNNSLFLPDILADGQVRQAIYGDQKYMTLSAPILTGGWSMATLVPYDSFMLAVTSLMQTIAGVSILVLLLACLLSKPIAGSITKRIDRLCSYMKQSKDGVLTQIPGLIYHDEIGMLYENYNYLISRTRTLISENYKMGRDLKSAEFKALQSQINPHFLYNTLDMISWMSYRNKSSEISSVVYDLAHFYKLSLNKGQDIVRVSDEISHVGYYMNIQDLRFSGNILFKAEPDPVVLPFSIPRITLQPIVENALFHGILEKPSRTGTIRITGVFFQDGIRITVEDDGVGIPSEKLARIYDFEEIRPQTADCVPVPEDGGKPTEEGGSHYGIGNIHSRIRLQYGSPYGLTFESTPGQGTRVHIDLPAVHVDEL